jgi:hypothetical protein
MAAGDIFTHGWDLAKATGQPTDLDPELAGALLARITQMLPDSMRGPEGQAPFGPSVGVAASAPTGWPPSRGATPDVCEPIFLIVVDEVSYARLSYPNHEGRLADQDVGRDDP